MRILVVVNALVLIALPAAAQIDNPTPRPQPQATAKPAAKKRPPATPKAPRDVSLPLAERIAIQFDLAWTADYNGLIDGEFTDKTIAAIKAFQGGRKFKETGVLKAEERALLAAASKARQRQVGWTMVDDPVTGARLGYPDQTGSQCESGKTGTKWSSAQGQVQVETFRIREPGTTLAMVYEQQKKAPPTRRLAFNFLRPDFFVLSGMQSLKRFYVRAEFKDGEVRGMTVLYDQANEPIMDPVAAAMTGAFAGFPGAAGITQIGSPPRRKVEYGTGIIVSAAGHILTDRHLTEGCNVIVVGGHGNADRQAEDTATRSHAAAGVRRTRAGTCGVYHRDQRRADPCRHRRAECPRRRQRDLDRGGQAQGRPIGAIAAARLRRRRCARPPRPLRRHGRSETRRRH